MISNKCVSNRKIPKRNDQRECTLISEVYEETGLGTNTYRSFAREEVNICQIFPTNVVAAKRHTKFGEDLRKIIFQSFV